MTRKRKQRIKPPMLTGLVMMFVVLTATWAITQESKWYPSQWGPDDQRGAANRITPAKVLEAVSLIKEGKIYQLGRVYEVGMPLVGTRHYSLMIPHTTDPSGENQLTSHDEIFSGQIGQVGTQFDGLGHVGIGDLYYNGFNRHDFAKPGGLTKLGVENVGVFFTRGVLIDIAGYKGVEHLEGGYEITLADLKGALKRQGTEIKPGDFVLFHTGWGKFWMTDNERYGATEPGIGLEAGKYLVDQQIVIAGADTWAIEVVPNPNESLSFPVHQLFLPKNGIYNLENLITENLVRDKAYEFAFVFSPLRLKGATGSPGNPIAIR